MNKNSELNCVNKLSTDYCLGKVVAIIYKMNIENSVKLIDSKMFEKAIINPLGVIDLLLESILDNDKLDYSVYYNYIDRLELMLLKLELSNLNEKCFDLDFSTGFLRESVRLNQKKEHSH